MAVNCTIVTDQLVYLLNDKSAEPKKYHELLSNTDTGQLFLTTGFDSVIAQLEDKVSDN